MMDRSTDIVSIMLRIKDMVSQTFSEPGPKLLDGVTELRNAETVIIFKADRGNVLVSPSVIQASRCEHSS